MKRRRGTQILSLLLTLVLCLSLLPAAALAEEAPPGAQLMGEGEISFVQVDENGWENWEKSFYPFGGSEGYGEPVPSNVRFDESTHTLTLENYDGPDRAVAFWVGDNDFKINLVGSSTIYKLTSGHSITLTGSGSLSVLGEGVRINAREDEPAVFTVEDTVSFQAACTDGSPAVAVSGSSVSPAIVIRGSLTEGGIGRESGVLQKVTVDKDPSTGYSSREVWLYKNTIENTIFSGWTTRNGYDYTQVKYFGVQGGYPATGTKGDDPATYDLISFSLFPLFGDEESGFVWSEYGSQSIWNDETYGETCPGIPFDKTVTDISYYIPSYEPVLGDGEDWTVVGGSGKALSAVTVNPTGGGAALPTLAGYVLPEGKTGAAYSGSVTFSPAEGGTLRYVKQSGADWLTVDAATGRVSGTPDRAGAWSLVVTAAETAGGETRYASPMAFTVRVTDPVARLTLKNALNDGRNHTLTIRQGETVTASYHLGSSDRAAGSVFQVPLPEAGKYTAVLTASLTDRDFTYCTESFTAVKGQDLDATLNNGPFSAVEVRPEVTGAKSYRLEWYSDSSGDPDKLVSRGSACWMEDGETLYVRAVPLDRDSLFYSPSSLVKADRAVPALTTPAIPGETVSGTVTRNGQPLRNAQISVTVTGPEGYSHTYWSGTFYRGDGSFSFTDLPLAGLEAVLKVSHEDIDTVTLTLTPGSAEGLAIEAPSRTGLLDCSALGYGNYGSVTVTKGKTVIPAKVGSQRVFLEETGSLKAGDTLTLSFRDESRCGETSVTLDSALGGAVPEPAWQYYERVSFSAGYASGLNLQYAVFNGDSLFRSETLWSGTSQSGYYPQGSYTVLLTERNTWNLLTDEDQSSLTAAESALNALGGSLYTIFDFHTADRTGSSAGADYVLTPPANVIPSAEIDRTASGLALDAEGETVTVRCTVAPNDPAGKKKLFLQLGTNQISDISAATPTILNGSLYINGRRAEENVVKSIFPNNKDHLGSFNGLYSMTIPDVDVYGGWPVTVQWQSGRTVMDLVGAAAAVKIDDGSLLAVGSASLESPAVTLLVPESVGSPSFSVTGQAPENSLVTLYRDGVEVSQVLCVNGIYTARMDLGDPWTGEEHTVSASVTVDGRTVSTEPQTVAYEPQRAVLARVEVTNYYGGRETLWEEGASPDGYYYYLPDREMKYILTFDNAASADALDGDVTVSVPTNDGILELTASYRGAGSEAGQGVWETGNFKPGSNPPTGAYVSYTAAVPDYQLTENDLAQLGAKAQEAMDGWAEAVQPENLPKLKTRSARLGLTLTDNNDADTREMKLTLDSVEYPVDIEYKGETMDVTFAEETGVEYTVTTTMQKGRTMDLAAERDIFARLESGAQTLPGEKTLYPIADSCRFQRISMENGALTLRDVRRALAENGKTVWGVTEYTPTTCTAFLFNEGGGYLQTVTYTRSAAMDLSDGGETMAEQAALMTVIWTAGLEGVESALFGNPVSVLPKSGDAVLQSAETARLMAGKTTVQGIPISKDPNIAFYQMLNTALYLNGVKMDYDINSEGFWYGQVPGSAHTNGKIFGSTGLHTKWKEGGEMILKVNEIKDNAVCTYGPGALNLAMDGPGTALREYLKGQLEGNYYSNYWNPFGWFTRGEKERKCREQTADWDYVNAMLDKMEADGKKVDRSFMPPRPQDVMDAAKDKAKKNPKSPEKKAPEKKNDTPTPTPTPTTVPTTTTTIAPPRGTPNTNQLGYVNRFETFTVPDYRKPIIDPSGVVYEGVPSNPVQGVTASLYQVTDAGKRVLWDAAEYGQTNPQITGGDGAYQWMVPQGKWSVTFTGEGYETYTTGENDGYGAARAGDVWYMPVAPAQMDVNINLQRTDSPRVTSAVPTKNGVQVTFNQYMDAATLTADKFSLLVNSKPVRLSAQTIRLSDEEKNGGKTCVREILLKAALSETDRVSLTVDRTVESCGGKPMAANYVLADAALQSAGQAEIVSVTAAGSRVTAVISCSNAGGTVYCAAYGQDGQMVTVQSLPAGTGTEQSRSFDLKTTAYQTVQVFVLDGSFRPLCACREVPRAE